MKKLKNIIILIACLTLDSAFARLLENGALDQINNSVALDISGLNLKYREIFFPSMGDNIRAKSTEAGTIIGFSFDARKAFLENIYTDLALDYYSGKLKYDGVYVITYQPLVNKFQHKIFNAAFKSGYIFTFTESNSFQVVPYVGVGYHYWHRQSDNYYDGKYQHIKAIAGLKLNWLLTDAFVLSPYAEGGKVFNTSATSYGDETIRYKLGKKPIYEAGLEANYKLFDEFFLNGFASYTQFKYGRSENKYTPPKRSFEPDSKTNEIKFGLGVRYSWMIN